MKLPKNNDIYAKFDEIAYRLEALYPTAVCSLEYGKDAWRLLVMARLSAQCTDARVNIVSRELFARFPSAEAMAEADLAELENLVRPCGLYRMKSKDIKKLSAELLERFDGKVPDNMEALLSLSGIGRKIANLILGDVYHIPGIVADTHCIRIAGRLGAYAETMKSPQTAEKILSEIVRPELQTDLCHRFVLFGRDICTARSPKCTICPLSDICEHHTAEKE